MSITSVTQVRGRLAAGATARQREREAVWARAALAALLAGSALLYLWDLSASGWANGFYSAAVQAGSTSWKAFFFGSFDSSNFITVDKPPASLWVMDISARIFGVNSWSILVPEALAGVGTVALVYATVRRWFSASAALLAGAVVALTPVAGLMFRFNNPDALLVLLLTASAYAMTRAVEAGRTRWLMLAATLVGFGFMTKMLQAFLVVPAFALVFLVAAPTPLRKRVLGLLAAGIALVVASGWWVAVVQLIPAADRPYIGGSQDNSILNLIFGYNGFGRLTGNETGSVGGNAAGGSMWGPTGWNRLFLDDFGSQVSWLIPASLVLLGACLWLTRRAPRLDRTRAAMLLWGGWLLVTAVVFSYASGIIHPYYTVALAPPIGVLVGVGATTLWRRRAQLGARMVLAAALAATTIWAGMLLARSPDWNPWLRVVVLVVGLGAAAAILVAPLLGRPLAAAAAVAAIVAGLAAPAAYTIDTVLTPHTGAIPSAGPAVTTGVGLGGGFGGRGAAGGPGGGFSPPPGGFGGIGGPLAGGAIPGGAGGFAAGGPAGGFAGGPGGGSAAGGLLDASAPGSAITALLATDASRYSWVAAVVGANSAAGYQLATGDAVLAIGGFNGTDPTPTLAEFQSLVQQHRIHYFIAGRGGFGGGPGGAGGSSSASAISSWVEANYTATTVDGITVYDLSGR